MTVIDNIFYIVILIASVVIHEVSHGFMAERFGDDTARSAGRLTLNPIKHMELFGSVILPAVLILSHAGFVFGWAKPVPYNPNNLRNVKWGTIAVALSGVLANFFISVFFGLAMRFSAGLDLPAGFYFITSVIVTVNLALGIFNLIPIPPLDGSKVLFYLFPESVMYKLFSLERYSFFLLIIFVVFFADYLYPVLGFLFRLLTGFAL